MPTEQRIKRLAAIDIGSNSVRLMVAEATPDGEYRVLDDEKETTRLAENLARQATLSEPAMAQTIAALKRMKTIAEGYGVERLAVIATSAVREASNRRRFVKRIREEIGLEIDVISPNEEGRLSFASVERHFDLKDVNAVVVDLGGGSSEIVFAANGMIEDIFSMPIGAVRLTESCIQSDPPTDADYKRLKNYIRKQFRRAVDEPNFVPQLMIGAGGTFMALANISMRKRGEASGSVAHHELTRSEVRHISDQLRSLPLRSRRAVPGLNADRADIIIAGVVVIERLMKLLRVNRLQVHDRGVRDGLMVRMIAEAFGTKLKPAEETADPLAAVQQFAATCGFEQQHSHHVAKLALQLFDQLQAPLKLPNEERLLLEAAAYLHEIGYLINYEKHHKHSYHLILHGNLRGVTPKQRELIANIARYHRKSMPKLKHENFARLNSDERATVMRMGALLRLADGLERTHMQRVQGVECELRKKSALVTVVADKLPEVDMWGGKQKGDLFEKVFGVSLEFAWRPAAMKSVRVRGAAS